MNNAELIGLIATVVTAILIRLIDHYLPGVVDQAHRLNNTHLARRPPVSPDDDDPGWREIDLDEHAEDLSEHGGETE